MHALGLMVLAAFVGALTVELFLRAWLGMLGSAVALARTVVRGWSGAEGRARLSRFSGRFGRAVLSALLLAAVFRVYLHSFALGVTEAEQYAYFLGCVVRIVPALATLLRDVGALFDSDEDE